MLGGGADDDEPSSPAASPIGRPRTARARHAAAGSAEHPRVRSGAAVVAVKRIFAAETGNYFLLLGATLFLVTFGLVMVLSSSAV